MRRAEHPKPQFERAEWENLNGEWSFEIDNGASGDERGLFEENARLNSKIQVPFCPESKLSGVENKDFMARVWYQREINIDERRLDGIVRLHFGAVDYKATVYINGKEVGTHKGGYVSFSFDVTKYLRVGKNVLTVRADDDTRNLLVPSGKQSARYKSFNCYYTRTTGIWQTVWLEFLPKAHVKSVKYYPNVKTGELVAVAETVGKGVLSVQAFFDGKFMGEAEAESNGETTVLTVKLKEKHLWTVGKGGLYDLKIKFNDDEVKSYFGLRSLRLDGYKFLINDKSVFQRLILDQGFYPDGIYTAPSDAELEADIDRSMAMGFNGARLHEKVFEERFLYYCDKKGYIVWGEYPNWGLDVSFAESIFSVLPEWLEEIERDFNHPSIVGWCPFNETWEVEGRRQRDDVIKIVYLATKAVDKTRPCIDTSGHYHVTTDIFDVHSYENDVEKFRAQYQSLVDDGTLFDTFKDKQTYVVGQPTFVSEYGGIGWTKEGKGWGYGNEPQSEEEFLSRLKGLTDVLLDNKNMFGFCYTQLTDVEQEQNGLYTYDREAKFPSEIIRPIFARKAAIEDDDE